MLNFSEALRAKVKCLWMTFVRYRVDMDHWVCCRVVCVCVSCTDTCSSGRGWGQNRTRSSVSVKLSVYMKEADRCISTSLSECIPHGAAHIVQLLSTVRLQFLSWMKSAQACSFVPLQLMMVIESEMPVRQNDIHSHTWPNLSGVFSVVTTGAVRFFNCCVTQISVVKMK